MCVEESTADSTLQLPQELKDTWHEVIFRSFQLLSSLYSGNGTQQQCFNRLQLLSPAVVLWDKFRFDRKYINSWKQQFIEALNEEVVVRKVTSSNTEVFMLRNYSDISLSRTSVPSTCSSNGIGSLCCNLVAFLVTIF